MEKRIKELKEKIKEYEKKIDEKQKGSWAGFDKFDFQDLSSLKGKVIVWQKEIIKLYEMLIDINKIEY